MQPPPTGIPVPLIGIVVELASCLLFTFLVLGLRRDSRHRSYFMLWSWAWIALSVAIAAITLRYTVVPTVAPGVIDRLGDPLLAPIYLVYQLAKLLFFGFVSLGVVVLASDRSTTRREVVGTALAASIAGIVSVAITRRLNYLVAIQAGLVVPTLAVAAWRSRRIPASRRGPGTEILSVALIALVVQWFLYLQAFGQVDLPKLGFWSRLLGGVAASNSYLDAGVLIILGIGMVLTIVEHNHRDAGAAQTARIGEATVARERLGEILRAAHEGIITLRGDRTIDLMNPAAETILGVMASEVTGQSFDQFLREDQRPSLWDAVALSTRRSEANPPVALRREAIGLRANGDEFPMEISLSSTGDVTFRGYVLVLRDLTDQNRAREDQVRLQEQLAQTARLEAVGRMVSGVAHELNNPLTAIMAFAQDLAMNAKTPDDREALTVITQQAERCRVIVGDLLIFARSRRDERRRIAPGELVSRVARVFERESTRHRIDFQLTVASNLPPIDVDAAGMEQVLTNLLTNAFQASPAGSQVGLSVTTRVDRVAFLVEDSGPGIAPDAMPRLFEPFFTTKPPGEGTGLGLSVSHAIVSQHGGSITAENREMGGGARFVVEVPFVNRRQAAEELPNGSEPVGAGDGADGGHALVVDDEVAIRTAIRRSLERRGWTVDEAADGAEAWLRLDIGGRPAAFDLVITDLRMPGMSGIELVDRLRSSHPTLADRTVVITGDTASPAVADFLGRLATPYLQKPFDLRTLADLVDRMRPSSSHGDGRP